MDAELADKHHEERKFRKQVRVVIIELKSSLSLVLFHTVIHQVGIAVKSKIKCIKSRHEKKLDKFLQRQSKLYRNDSRYYFKNTVHKFSSCVLSSNEELALAYCLEQHIPIKLNKHTNKTEFQAFHESLVKNIFQKMILV